MFSGRMRVIAAVAAAGLLAAGCGSQGGGASAGPQGDEKITLSLNLFGNMGFKELYTEYEAAHPNIKIVERTSAYNDHHRNLAAHLATSRAPATSRRSTPASSPSSAGSRSTSPTSASTEPPSSRPLAAVEVGGVPRQDGAQIGYGTDVGGLAMCYRRDLFEKAGLPTDRDEVAKLWPDWDAYFEAGKKFKAKKPDGATFFDGAAQHLQRDHRPGRRRLLRHRATSSSIDGNPAVSKAYDQVAAGRRRDGLSAKLRQFRRRGTPASRRAGSPRSPARPGCSASSRTRPATPQGQVGRRHGPRRRRQLGRLLPDRAEAEQAPQGGRRAGRAG